MSMVRYEEVVQCTNMESMEAMFAGGMKIS